MPRLQHIILETAADCAALRQDAATIRPDVRERVLRMFTHIVATTAPGEYDTNDVLLILDDFADACLVQACSAFLREDRDKIISAFPDASIWGIEGFARALVVFFHTDADVRQKQDDGTCARIAQRCRELASRHDEFGYLTPATFQLKFDSKQTLDRDYAGNLYYYFK